jgi:hypothetical protein
MFWMMKKFKKEAKVDRFKVSGAELCQHYTDLTPLSQVFSDIERELQLNKQVVCQFIVNGMALREEDEIKFSTLPLKDVTTLEYLTEKTQDLVESVLGGWIEALPELIEKTDKLSVKIRTQGVTTHLRDIRDLIDNCQFLISSIISLKSILGDSVVASVSKWDEAEQWTEKTLAEALQAFEKKDFALLADVVDYDLNHGLLLWVGILKSVQAIFTGKPVDSNNATGSNSVDRQRISN